jgi:hypothetical protein
MSRGCSAWDLQLECGGLAQVDEWITVDASPVQVNLTGYPSSLPSGYEREVGVAGVLSVGYMKQFSRVPDLRL